MKPFDIETDHLINPSNIQEDMIRFPSVLYHYTNLRSIAEEKYLALKSQLEELEARTYVRIKATGEKITENHLNAVIMTDFQVIGKRNDVLTAKHDFETLKNYIEALRSKQQMLIQISADMRAEKQ